MALAPAVQKLLLALPDPQKVGAVVALLELGGAFGNPHVHSGLGIRKLRGNIFECRAGLSNRFGFVSKEEQLIVLFLGNHDGLKRWLRGLP